MKGPQTYHSVQAAVEAGHKLEDLCQLRRFTSGPFRGRVYELVNGRLGRRREDIEAEDARKRAALQAMRERRR